jgi:hypothetical protein
LYDVVLAKGAVSPRDATKRKKKMKPSKLRLVDLEALSGPAPVLRTEDREGYDKFRAHFLACFSPQDILEWQLVHRLIDDAWFIARYSRHKTVAVERWFQQSLDFQVQRVISQQAKKEAVVKSLADEMTQKPAEVAHLVHLEQKVTDLNLEIEAIRQRTPTELEHNRALEKSIVFQEQLDRLVASTTKRFNETLQLLEHYKEGFGERLRKAAEEFFKPEGENPPSQSEAPSMVPSDGGAVENATVDQNPTATEESK